MSFALITPGGGGLMACHTVATAAQTGVTAGKIKAGADTTGSYDLDPTRTTWTPQNKGLNSGNKQQQIAAVYWSAQEIISGVSALYALSGDSSGAPGNAQGGGLLVRPGDSSAPWSLRSAAVQGSANHANTPLPTGQYPRPTGRLIAEDSFGLYVATYGTGVKRSVTRGADNFPVTFTMGGTAPALGDYYCFAIFLDSAGSGNLYLATYATTASNGSVWVCNAGTLSGQLHSSNPDFTKITLPTTGGATGRGTSNGTGPEIHDVIVVDGVIYLACGNQGIWANSGAAGAWRDLSGAVVDTSAGNSLWTSLDGYYDTATTNHVIVTACSNGVKPSGATSFESAIMVTAASHGTGALTYTHLTTTSNVTMSPVPGYGASWNSSSGYCLGQQGFNNPQIRFDPTDATHSTLLCSGSQGFYIGTLSGGVWSWQVINNGDASFLGHAALADPNNAGHVAYGDSDWGAWETFDGVGGATSLRRITVGGALQSFAFAFDPVDSTMWTGAGKKYANPNTGGMYTKAWNASTWTAMAAPFTKCPLGLLAFRDATGQKVLLAAVLNSGMWKWTATGGWGAAAQDTVIGSVLTSGGTTTGLRYPIVNAGGGVLYCYDHQQGVFRSSDYGNSWGLIWSKTSTSQANAGELAVNPNTPTELWVSASDGLWKLPGANTGTVTGGSITPVKITDPLVANCTGIAFDSSGYLYVATADTGAGSGLVRTTSTTTPAWKDIVGDTSFQELCYYPQNITIGPDKHIYVSGPNTVAQGFVATSSSPTKSAPFTELQNSAALSGSAGTLAAWFNETTGGPGIGGAGQASTAWSLLQLRIETSDGAQTFTAPTGWALRADIPASSATSGTCRVLIFDWLNHPGGLYGTSGTAASFTYSNIASVVKARLTEFVTPAGTTQYVDQVGIPASGTAPTVSMPVTAAGPVTYQTGLGCVVFGAHYSATPTGQTWTAPGGGWLTDNSIGGTTDDYVLYSKFNLATGAPTVTGVPSTSTNMTAWAAAMVTYYALANTPVTVSTTTLPTAMVGVAYAPPGLVASGGATPVTWAKTAGSIPPGLAISTAGVITGTPTTANAYTGTYTVTDAAFQTANGLLTITVLPALTVSTATPLPGGQVAAPYSLTLAATGGTGTYGWAQVGGTLPPGLSLSGAGLLSGVPVLAGTYSFTAQVTDSGFTATKTFTVTIAAGVLTITTASLAAGRAATAYNAALNASQGNPPYVWSAGAGQLPPGLRLDPGTGILSGLPQALGTYPVTFTATDTASNHASVTLTIVITVAPAPAVTTPWHFIICKPQPDGSQIAEVQQSQQRSVTFRSAVTFNHEATIDVDGTSPVALEITELETDLQVWYGGQVLFTGRFGAAQDTLNGTTHRFAPTALDYRAVLSRRSLAYGGGPAYTNTDMADIAWGLLTAIQAYPGGQLGISRGVGASGLGTKYTWNYVRQQVVSAAFDTLAQLGNGFEWDITPYGGSDLRLDMWAPQRGSDRGVILEYGGPIVGSVTRTTDPTLFADSVFVTPTGTAPTGGTLPTPVQLDASDIATRPEGRWDAVIGSTILTQGAFNDYAQWSLGDLQVVLPAYTVALKPGTWEGPSHIWLGDTVRLRLKSGRLNIDTPIRVAEMAFTLDANNRETLTLTLGRVPFRSAQQVPKIMQRISNLETL